MSLPLRPLLHIAERAVWETDPQNEYRVPSLETEGFIHLSHPEQVVTVADFWFRGRIDLVLLVIAPTLLTAPVREDAVPGHGTFPHLYGPLNRDAVVAVMPFVPDPNGSFHLPDAFPHA